MGVDHPPQLGENRHADTRKACPRLVGAIPNAAGPPRALGFHGQKLWSRVQGEFAITDVGGIEILAQICGALDTAELLAEAVSRDGPIFQSRTGPRVHPGVKEMLACRSFICKGLARLGILDEAIKAVGRPGSPIGWQPAS